MREEYSPQADPEKAYLVAVTVRGSRPLLNMQESLDELTLLAKTAGMNVVGHATQAVHSIDPSTFVGSGKLEEIAQDVVNTSAQSVIFDDELSPRHQREIERRLGENVKVLDRSALILDIFAQHAQTREGSLQVELAQYEYRLPRLTRQWSHLSRQTGGSGSSAGVGLRGPGETQLEVDKREINRKISKLKEELDSVRQHRSRHRQQRSRTGIPVIALVGYTNAGKSTLLNALTNANVYVADQLFATLDPTTRRLNLPSGRAVLFTDTVGFIQKLPTTLIAAFRATLEEVIEADLLLHVVDIAHPNVLQHIEAVEDTLAELDMPSVPRILVCNKADMLRGQKRNVMPESADVDGYYRQVLVSARAKTGLEDLLQAIEEGLSQTNRMTTLLLPYERGDLLSHLFEQATVISQEHTSQGVKVVAQLPPDVDERYKLYRIKS
jgi:GTP-binding protein HflX